MPALLMGAVAYDAKVVTIWNGFRRWFRDNGLDFDYVLYSNYERQVEDLLDGRIDAAWNSPLAWVRARRMAEATGTSVQALTMRDTDQDLVSLVVAAASSPVQRLHDLVGRTVGTGAVDSPQATLLPLDLFRSAGLEPDRDITVRRFDVGVGLHGDHVGGERDAARALLAGEVDAACIIDASHVSFVHEGLYAPGAVRVIAQTAPFDHCNMTLGVSAPATPFGDLLLSMDYGDPTVRPLLDLEGLTRWVPGRVDGYTALETAVDHARFYDQAGAITADEYDP